MRLIFGKPPEDSVESEVCLVCGSDLEWVDCWQCFGEGGFHDCGEDCCCCLEPELDLNETCDECHGEGGYLECPNIKDHAEAKGVGVGSTNARLGKSPESQ